MFVPDVFMNLNNATDENCQKYGGKFSGLVRCKTLLDKYNRVYGLNFRIPETIAIKTDLYDYCRLIESNIPEDLVNEVMHCVAKLGGHVAVRSSADIEDQKGKTYSGKFESVLGVKSKAQLREALNTVYASAKNVDGAKMGIVLQTMVAKPQMAGVVYSETVLGQPYIALNYVENQLADDLLRCEKLGSLFAISKYVFNPHGQKERLSLENLNNPEYEKIYVSLSNWKDKKATPQELEVYKKQFMLAALVNTLESDLGYPVDMEFAISENGNINILQQRAYCLPEFCQRKIDENITTYFMPQRPMASGEVSLFKKYEAYGPMKDIIVYRNKKKDEVKVFTNSSYTTFLMHEYMPLVFNDIFYTHYGNQQRENFDFSKIEMQGSAVRQFDNLQPNLYYYMMVDFQTAYCEYMLANNQEKILECSFEENLKEKIEAYSKEYNLSLALADKNDESEIAGSIWSKTPLSDRDHVSFLYDKADSEGPFFAISKYVFNPQGQKERLNLENLSNPEYEKIYVSLSTWEEKKATPQELEMYKKQFMLAALINILEDDLGCPLEIDFDISKDGKINISGCSSNYLPRSYTRENNGVTTCFSPDKTIIEGKVTVLDKIEYPSQQMNDIVVYKDEKSGMVNIYTQKSYLSETLLKDAFVGDDMTVFSELAFMVNSFHLKRSDLDFTKMTTDRMVDFSRIKTGDRLRIDLKSGQFYITPYRRNQNSFNLKAGISDIER